MRRLSWLALILLGVGLGSGCDSPPSPSPTETPPRFDVGTARLKTDAPTQRLR